jgi:hypothetical protein
MFKDTRTVTDILTHMGHNTPKDSDGWLSAAFTSTQFVLC